MPYRAQRRQPCAVHHRSREPVQAAHAGARLEKRVGTNNFCLMFGSTMMGMVIANSFFALQCFGSGKPQFKQQTELLALSLMRNPLRCAELKGPSPSISPPSSVRASPPLYADHSSHNLVPLRNIHGFQGSSQMRCQMCNHLTSWACDYV